jgi:hypothetical protein
VLHLWGGGGGAYRVLLEKPEGRRPLERPKRRWEKNIKMSLQEVRDGGMDWIGLAVVTNSCRDVVNAVMNHRVP